MSGPRLATISGAPRTHTAFTLLELLVVISIIVILAGVVVTVSTSAIEKARVRETQALLTKLNTAAEQFAEEKPLRQVRGYTARYGGYPPDELDGFLPPAATPPVRHIAPSGSDLVVPNDNALEDVDNGDIKAFALAVRLYSEKGAAILDRIPSRYRAPAHKDANGVPDEYLDRNGDGSFTPGEDEPLDYFIDAWGTPIAYFAARPSGGPSVWDSDVGGNVQAAGDRRYTCGALLSLSNDVPVFVSYGPDGPEQFNADFFENGFPPDLIYDFGQDDPEYTFDHPLNGDNIYSNETVRDKILLTEMPEGQPIEGS